MDVMVSPGQGMLQPGLVLLIPLRTSNVFLLPKKIVEDGIAIVRSKRLAISFRCAISLGMLLRQDKMHISHS
jgi:hypothetical protein